MPLQEARGAIHQSLCVQVSGLRRTEGLTGYLKNNEVRLAYMHSNLLNAWYVVFVGKMIASDDGSRLTGFYRKSYVSRAVNFSFALFSCFSIFMMMLLAKFGEVSEAKIIAFSIALLTILFAIFSFIRFCMALSSRDENVIDSEIRRILRCRV